MIQINCDICKKPIKGASRNDNYITIRNKSLCWPCKKDFLFEVGESWEEEKTKSLKGYEEFMWDELVKKCSK